jgi:hypothetical protein
VVWPQNHSDGFYWFDLKTSGDGFRQFGIKTGSDGFFRFDLKSVVGFLVEPQNQGGRGFPGLGLKIDSSGLVIWISKSPRRFLGLYLKTKQAKVCRLRHKTDGGRSARDKHRDLTACLTWKHVAPSRRLRQRQDEDGRVDTTGYVGPCYPCFTAFNVLPPRGIVVL